MTLHIDTNNGKSDDDPAAVPVATSHILAVDHADGTATTSSSNHQQGRMRARAETLTTSNPGDEEEDDDDDDLTSRGRRDSDPLPLPTNSSNLLLYDTPGDPAGDDTTILFRRATWSHPGVAAVRRPPTPRTRSPWFSSGGGVWKLNNTSSSLDLPTAPSTNQRCLSSQKQQRRRLSFFGSNSKMKGKDLDFVLHHQKRSKQQQRPQQP